MHHSHTARLKTRWVPILLAAMGLSVSGCMTIDRLTTSFQPVASVDGPPVDSALRAAGRRVGTSANDRVFYVGGAGDGGWIIDFSRDFQRGLSAAGFCGEFRPFFWQTGLGAISDECASVQYKREKARLLAEEIHKARENHPAAKICLIASSAGTAVCVFALEELGADERVDSVVLLSSALSSTCDLTSALRHLRGTMYVFSSPNDVLLQVAMPVFGTSDRRFVGAHVLGLEGVVRPADRDANGEYTKIRQIRWRPEWTALGNAGGHTDTKSQAFVAQVVAPLLFSNPALASSALSTRLRSVKRTVIDPATKSSTLKE